jgi:hypothetical protein
MQAIVVKKPVYSDWDGPMNDVIYSIQQLVIERDGGLIVITHLVGKVFVSLLNKDYLKKVSVQGRIDIPDDLVEKTIQVINTQKQLAQQLQEMNILSQLSLGNAEHMSIRDELFLHMAEYQLNT